MESKPQEEEAKKLTKEDELATKEKDQDSEDDEDPTTATDAVLFFDLPGSL
jgi:hypothetical protein